MDGDDKLDVHYQFLIKEFGEKIPERIQILWGETKKLHNIKIINMNKLYAYDRKHLNTFINLLFYNLKYRQYTPQTLELMIEAFLCGIDFPKK